jgi:hypothetical protein
MVTDDIELIAHYTQELATYYVTQYFDCMQSLGLDRDSAIEIFWSHAQGSLPVDSGNNNVVIATTDENGGS